MTLTMPDAKGRYQTAMVVDQDHYIERVFDRPGTYHLDTGTFATPFVAIAVRTLVDPNDPSDVAAVAFPTRYRSWTAGTMSCGSTSPSRRSLMVRGPSPSLNRRRGPGEQRFHGSGTRFKPLLEPVIAAEDDRPGNVTVG